MIYEVPVAFLPPSPITDQNHVEKFKFLTGLLFLHYPSFLILQFIHLFIWFFETGFLCSLEACTGTNSCRLGWSQTSRDLPASASLVLGLKSCITTAWFTISYVSLMYHDQSHPLFQPLLCPISFFVSSSPVQWMLLDLWNSCSP